MAKPLYILCPNCSGKMSNRGAKLCRKCAAETRRLPENIKKERKKKYKSEYFQKNKEKIYQKIRDRRANYSEEERNEKTRAKDNSVLKSRYGITIEELEALFQVQKGKCFICDNSFDDTKRKMTIDHNHDTGNIRGLLCRKCNSALGLFGEDIAALENSIRYLEYEKVSND